MLFRSVFCRVPGILPAVFLWEISGNKDTEPADRRAGSHSTVWGPAVRDGIFFTKGLYEFLGFHKAGSDPVHRIGDCIGLL